MAKINPKIEDVTVRMKLKYDGRTISPETKQALEDAKSSFFDALLEKADELNDQMEIEVAMILDLGEEVSSSVHLA